MIHDILSRPMNIKHLLAVALLISLSSCSAVRPEHAGMLQDAQTLFNVASELENELTIDPNSADAGTKNREVDSSYTAVHEKVSSLIEEERDAMTKDDLLGSAYTLKALTEWRLGLFDQANQTKEEVNTLNVNLFPRDRALMDALPFMMQNDEAKQLMDAKSNTFDSVSELLEESVHELTKLTSTDPAMDNVRFYLLTSQLSALKNWLDLINDPGSFVTDMPSDDKLDAMDKKWCDQGLKGVWNTFETEVLRMDSDAACQTHKAFSDILGPKGCEGIEVNETVCTDS